MVPRWPKQSSCRTVPCFMQVMVQKPRWGWSGKPAGSFTWKQSNMRNGSRCLTSLPIMRITLAPTPSLTQFGFSTFILITCLLDYFDSSISCGPRTASSIALKLHICRSLSIMIREKTLNDKGQLVVADRFKIIKELRSFGKEVFFKAYDRENKVLVLLCVNEDEEAKDLRAMRMIMDGSTHSIELLWEAEVFIGKKKRFCKAFKNYGPSIEELASGLQQVSTQTLFLTGYWLLVLIEQVHSREMLHLQLAPTIILTHENFTSQCELYLSSFSQCAPISKVETARLNDFSSLSLHLRQKPSFKDDYQSMFYILLWLYNRSMMAVAPVPTVSQRMKLLEELKMNLRFNVEDFMPMELVGNFLKTVRGLAYGEKINFTHWKKAFLGAAKAVNPESRFPRFMWQRVLNTDKLDSDEEQQEIDELFRRVNALPRVNYDTQSLRMHEVEPSEAPSKSTIQH